MTPVPPVANVVTGLDAFVPKFPTVAAYEIMFRQGRQSITYHPEFEAHGLSRHVAVVPNPIEKSSPSSENALT